MKINRKLIFLLIAGITASTSVYSQVRVKAEPGHGVSILNKDSTYYIKLGLRFQSLFEFTAPSDDISDAQSEFLIRRARLKADGFLHSPKLQYKVEIALSNRDIGPVRPEMNNAPMVVLDAVAKYSPIKNFSIWVGQTKLPGNRERVISSQDLQLVDRSILNSNFNLDRDMGIQLHAKQKLGGMEFRQAFALSQGEGRNVVMENQGFSYTGRLEWLPLGKFSNKGDYEGSALFREERPKLSIGGSYQYNDNNVRSRGALGSFLDSPRDLQTILADFMFKWGGWSVMGEFATRDYEIRNFEGTNQNVFRTEGNGYSIQSGYLLKSGYEVAARYSLNDFTEEFGADDRTMYTLGFSKYISGHNLKVQSDISYLERANQPNGNVLFRVQMEVGL